MNILTSYTPDAVIEFFANAETDTEWAIAFIALWATSLSESDFEVSLIGLTDLSDGEIATITFALRTGDLDKLNLSE